MFLLGLSVSAVALRTWNQGVSHFPASPPQYVHNDELHRPETKCGLDYDGYYSQEPVGTNVVDQPSTSNGTGVLPILKSPSCPVRGTAEGDNEAGDDKSNNQRDWRNS